MTESWLGVLKIDLSAIGLTKNLGMPYLGFSVGLIPIFVNGLDGQKIFFIGLASLGTTIIVWQENLSAEISNAQDLIATLRLPRWCYSQYSGSSLDSRKRKMLDRSI